MPKRFLFFIAIAQLLIILFHWLFYQAFLLLFPSLQPHHLGVAWALGVLSVSFLYFSVVDFNSENIVARVGYIVAAAWMPVFFYLFLASVLSLCIYLFSREVSLIAAPILYAAAVVLSVYGLVNARMIRITKVRVPLPNLPAYWHGKTAVMLSDLHLGHVLREGYARKLVARVNALHPDIVFIPGDFFDGVHTTFKELAELFKGIAAPHGIYYVSGNHEQIAGMRVCENALEETGIRVLDDQKVEVEGLQIVGTAYHTGETAESLRQIFSAMGIAREKPSVYLKHIPDHLDAAADAGLDLQLSGHTHLGQIWPFRFVTRRLFGQFDYGLHYFKDMAVYTSSGVGTWGPPMRVFTRSEIVSLTFINRS